MATITSARPDFNGVVAGVKFENGEASTDDEGAIAYFQRAGYDVTGAEGYSIELEADRPAAVIGSTYSNPDSGPYADAADPRNDLVPVGGVKADGTIVAGTSKGKKLAADTTPPVGITGTPEAVTPVAAPTAIADVAPADVPEPAADTNAPAPTPASDSTAAATDSSASSSSTSSKKGS